MASGATTLVTAASVTPDIMAFTTTFGRSFVSNRKTSPNWKFGKGTRKQRTRTFHSVDLSTPIPAGSPGPKYKYEDNIKYAHRNP